MPREVTQLYVQGSRRQDGHTNDGTPGDCYRAALASLIDEPIEVVPHFGLYLSWWDETRRWLQQRGRDLAYAKPGHDLYQVWVEEMPDALVMVGGPSPRGPFSHVCVGRIDGTVLWDPHPSRTGLLAATDFFLPVQPYAYLPERLMLPA